MNNYLVIWKPNGGDSTVNEMKIIDAYATNGSITQARKAAFDKGAEYAAEHGDGVIQVVKGPEHGGYLVYNGM